MTTFPLLCLAATYSERVYTKPIGQEREAHVEGEWRQGTKDMVIKSVPMDDANTIVFAIRGTQGFMDWAVNLNTTPASPGGFLVSSSLGIRFIIADHVRMTLATIAILGFLVLQRK